MKSYFVRLRVGPSPRTYCTAQSSVFPQNVVDVLKYTFFLVPKQCTLSALGH